MLAFSYISLTAIIILTLTFGWKLYVKEKGTAFKLLARSICLWLIYIIVLSASGIMQSLSFPPRFPIFVVLPLLSLYVLFGYRFKEEESLKKIPLYLPIVLQSFRIAVEFLLLYTYYKGYIPKSATFEGLNFDIVIGLSAPFIAYFFAFNKSRFLVLKLWNVLGVLTIVFVVFLIGSSLYFPSVWGLEEATVKLEFLTLPFIFIPTILAPAGIFLHIFSLIQISQLELT